MKNPLISLILCSRNDSYMGNSRWRLETSINLAILNAKKVNFDSDLEILVSDWGSEIPLSQVLNLVPEADDIVKFIHVPPDIAKVEQKDSKFPEVIALNAAARRASGEYIGRIDNDTVVGQDFFAKFRKLHENKSTEELDLKDSFMFVERRSIPFRVSRISLPLLHIEKFIERFKNHFQIESARDWGKEFWWSPVGIMIFHREIWNSCRGYDEKFLYWGWMEGDLALRLGQKHKVVEFSKFVGHHFYHLEHYPSLTAYKDRNGPATPRKKNEPVFDNLNYSENDENWGMKNFNQIKISCFSQNSINKYYDPRKIRFYQPVISSIRIYFALAVRKFDQLRMSFSPFVNTFMSNIRILIGSVKNRFLDFIVS